MPHAIYHQECGHEETRGEITVKNTFKYRAKLMASCVFSKFNLRLSNLMSSASINLHVHWLELGNNNKLIMKTTYETSYEPKCETAYEQVQITIFLCSNIFSFISHPPQK